MCARHEGLFVCIWCVGWSRTRRCNVGCPRVIKQMYEITSIKSVLLFFFFLSGSRAYPSISHDPLTTSQSRPRPCRPNRVSVKRCVESFFGHLYTYILYYIILHFNVTSRTKFRPTMWCGYHLLWSKRPAIRRTTTVHDKLPIHFGHRHRPFRVLEQSSFFADTYCENRFTAVTYNNKTRICCAYFCNAEIHREY